MAAAGLELGLFADYAAFRKASGQPLAVAIAQRTHDLVEFITGWIDPSVPVHVLLADIARHEHAMVRLTLLAPVDVQRDDAQVVGSEASAVPEIRGRIALHEMHCDPLLLAGALRQSVPRLADTKLQTRYYCYWRGSRDPEVAVLELDEFGYYALSLVDGRRSLADLSEGLGGRRRPTRRFTHSLGQLVALGLLRFGPGPPEDAV